MSAQHTDPALKLAADYAGAATRVPPLRVAYRRQDNGSSSAESVLAAVCFSEQAVVRNDSPLCVHVQMRSLVGDLEPMEVWSATGKVLSGQDGHVRYACDEH